MKRFIPMVGNEYGQLTVIERNMRYSSKNYHWNCRCSCGNLVVYAGTRLRAGHHNACVACTRNQKLEQENMTRLVQDSCNTINACYQDANGQDVFIRFDKEDLLEKELQELIDKREREFETQEIDALNDVENARSKLAKIEIVKRMLKEIMG